MLVCRRKSGEFSSDDVDKFSRIMHTCHLKGHLHHDEFSSHYCLLHISRDLFFYIRDEGLIPRQNIKELFNLMFPLRGFPM